jgi:hypothetical protein
VCIWSHNKLIARFWTKSDLTDSLHCTIIVTCIHSLSFIRLAFHTCIHSLSFIRLAFHTDTAHTHASLSSQSSAFTRITRPGHVCSLPLLHKYDTDNQVTLAVQRSDLTKSPVKRLSYSHGRRQSLLASCCSPVSKTIQVNLTVELREIYGGRCSNSSRHTATSLYTLRQSVRGDGAFSNSAGVIVQ